MRTLFVVTTFVCALEGCSRGANVSQANTNFAAIARAVNTLNGRMTKVEKVVGIVTPVVTVPTCPTPAK